MEVRFLLRPGHPDFLDLPWTEPLEGWRDDRLVEVPRGISRHVVRFVEVAGKLYGLKELPQRLAEREYRLLRALEDRSIPCVKVVGVVSRGSDEHEAAVLITRHLEYSLPYRRLFTGRGVPDVRQRLLDALSQLLVRLHLAGFFWGDCSLSNTLFRRDAGALSANLVDAETGELHPQLSDGQREHDLAIAESNIAGELFDLEAAGELPDDVDPVETALGVIAGYQGLWTELTRVETFGPDERYRIDQRVRRLHELGFDVAELELTATPEGTRLALPAPTVVEPGHHQRRLFELTGLWAQENQARRMLDDMAGYKAWLEMKTMRQIPEAVGAHRWVMEVFEPTIAMVPADLVRKMQAAELFHEILEHRWFLSEAEGGDVGMERAVASYVERVLTAVPDERTVLPTSGVPTQEAPGPD
jgi:hypothetical protein